MGISRFREILKSSTYVMLSNFTVLAISVFVILVLPKLVGVEDYGYWQLYLLYVSYIGFFHLGWVDGIYLRYGGKYYQEIDKRVFFSQFLLLTVFQLSVTVCILLLASQYTSSDRTVIFSAVAVSLTATNLKIFFVYILQATNRIKESAILQSSDRLFLLAFFIILLVGHRIDYINIIWADVLARGVSLAIAMYLCSDIVFSKLSQFKLDIWEVIQNIKSGIGLMFSNVASMLIIGFVRFSIEAKWGVALFGKVSLILSASNLFLVFVNAFGIVFFPLLRRMEEERIKETFLNVRSLLLPALFFGLLLYYPVRWLLEIWLPEYKEGIGYLAFLFPVVIFESRMALLNNTYMKALRLEYKMLTINLCILLISIASVLVTILYFSSMAYAIISITFLLWLRCTVFDIYLAKTLRVDIVFDLICEIVIVLSFIFMNNYLPWHLAIAMFSGILCIYSFSRQVYKRKYLAA